MDLNTWLCVSLRRLRWTPKASLPAERKRCLFVAVCGAETFYSMAATISEGRRKWLQAIAKMMLFLCWAFLLNIVPTRTHQSNEHAFVSSGCIISDTVLLHVPFTTLFCFMPSWSTTDTFHQHIWQRIILITYIIWNIYYTLLVISKKTPPNMLYSVSVFIAIFF